jgi:hypothetical protein
LENEDGAATTIPSRPGSPPFLRSIIASQQSLPAEALPEKAPLSPSSPLFVIEPPYIDLGTVENGRPANFYFKIRNLHPRAIHYRIKANNWTDQVTTLKADAVGEISGLETFRIDFLFLCSEAGRKDYIFTVESDSWSLEFKFTIRVLQGRYLEFLDHVDANLHMNLGTWYILSVRLNS